jgi:hypothetical protein
MRDHGIIPRILALCEAAASCGVRKLRDFKDPQSTSPRVLLVETEALVLALSPEFPEECALKVDVAPIGAEALTSAKCNPSADRLKAGKLSADKA